MNRWDGYGELYHHGILGQKWGIRRYQNEDGSLTEEGKKRYYYTTDGTKISNRKANIDPVANTAKGLGIVNYSEDTMRQVAKDIKKETHKHEAYRIKAGAKAGVAVATSMLLSTGVGMLVPMASTGAAVGGAIGAQTARQQIYAQGEEEASRALGYDSIANMAITKYDAYAKNAGMPDLKSTYKYIYGKDNYMDRLREDGYIKD